MQLQILGSGSKGNSSVIKTGAGLILIDNGFSGKELERRLRAAECNPGDVIGIVVSHDHSDHVNGAGIFARRYKIPVYMNKGTYQLAMQKFKNTNINFFTTGETLQFGSLHIETFPVPHDASDPVGFLFSRKNGTPENEAEKLGFLTDLGEITPDIIDRVQNVRALVVETNHDEHLLMNGPYPWSLKQRIRSRTGHLSNETAARFISSIVNSTGISEVTIAHLSEKNNEPNLAADTVHKQVEEQCGSTINVRVASQHEPTHIIDF